ncbi:MAG: hypothetical protein ACJ8DI_18065 [Ktedonobacteraceae bacterium]
MESDLPMELAKASTPGAGRGGLQETRTVEASPSQEEAQASSRGWATGDYPDSPRACRQGLSGASEQSRNAQIFVFTHEARDPWERLGGTAFPPSPND